MRRERLRLPLRLARQALDRAGSELAAAVNQRRALEGALDACRDARHREQVTAGRDLQVLASFVERSRRLERELAAQLAAAEVEERATRAALAERRLELRRLELLGERAAREEAERARRLERRALDDLVVTRCGDRRR